MAERELTQRWPMSVLAGLLIGAVEALTAVALATLVFGGLLAGHVGDGIGLYLGGAVATLAIFAWRTGSRGLVGGLQVPTAVVLSVVATSTALGAFGGPDRAFLTVVAVTMVVCVLAGGGLVVLGVRRRANLIRFVPVPVAGGLFAGIGWLLLKGGIGVASSSPVDLASIGDLTAGESLERWLPALALGAVVLIAVRLARTPLAIPVVLAIGAATFVVGMLVTGSSIQDAKDGGWMLGPLGPGYIWGPWTARALTGADWMAVLEQWGGILVAVGMTAVAALSVTAEAEIELRRHLDTNRELRDVGLGDVVVGPIGGIPGSLAVGASVLAGRMRANARTAGIVGALVPLTVVVLGGQVVEVIPRALVGGILVFLGLGLLVGWLWDRRHALSRLEYVVVLLILAAVVVRGFLPGVVLGVVLAFVLFAVGYGRIDQVREAPFGETYHSNAERPAHERAALRAMGERVRILRVEGFVFFGSASRLLERVRITLASAPPRFLVIDLRRVSGVDASAAFSFAKVAQATEVAGAELVVTGASERVRRQLARGGLDPREGAVTFEPDLDRGLERCEDALLAVAPSGQPGSTASGMPSGLEAHLERLELAEGEVLFRQGDAGGDLYVLGSGELSVETTTAGGARARLRSVLPGVVVGEVAMFTGSPRTADVVAAAPSTVLRLSRDSIARIERDELALAAALHEWLATTLAERLADTLGAADALLDPV